MVKLKKGQEAFVIVDGPQSGRKFEPGVEYEKAPKGYENRFAPIRLEKPPQVKTVGRKEGK